MTDTKALVERHRAAIESTPADEFFVEVPKADLAALCDAIPEPTADVREVARGVIDAWDAAASPPVQSPAGHPARERLIAAIATALQAYGDARAKAERERVVDHLTQQAHRGPRRSKLATTRRPPMPADTHQRPAPTACPCGNDVLQIGEGFLDDGATIECTKCGREASADSRDEAVLAWNARTRDELETRDAD